MKLGARDLPGYFARPDLSSPGLLIYGGDPMRIALRRQEVIAALIGPEGEGEMRLTRLPAADLRKDPARVADALRETGFFPGQRVVFAEDATDSVSPALKAALQGWQKGDAILIVTAGQLSKSSSLRKLFEDHPSARAAALYDDPPPRAEIEAELKRANVPELDRDAQGALEALARSLDPGDLRQTIEKLALYMLGAPGPVTVADIEAVAPATLETEVDDVLNVVAEFRSQELGPLLRRIEGQGIQPVSLIISATRHFRTLHAIAADPGGPAQGIGRLRPPVFGPRRDRLLRQASQWGRARLEEALHLLIETDLTLRSTSRAPAMPLVERSLIRLSMMERR